MKKEISIKNEIKHLALYRKYRPKTFGEMLGQEIVVEILKNSINNNKISHAYLFCGSRGTGKTSMARIFAQEIGSHEDDIFELDAASNNSVDYIRTLTEASQSSTFGSRYKIYILDEAHMLSKAAANALLKTLEEPPSHVIFILATTDKHKLPSTIISRCLEINFKTPDIESLTNLISFIAKKEDFKIEKESSKLIAKFGKGSYRDAIGVLEKIIAYVGEDNNKNIIHKDIEKILGVIDKKEIIKFIKNIIEKRLDQVLIDIKNFKLDNIQKLEKFYFDFIKIFELALLLRIDTKVAKDILCDDNSITELSKEDLIELEKLAKDYPKFISSSTLLKFLEIEKKISESSILKETVFVVGILNIIDTM